MSIKSSGSPLREDDRGFGFGLRDAPKVCDLFTLLSRYYPDLETRSHYNGAKIN
ncbi:hypothetical protein [Coleofasciculus chthonoplastes]|uniref:hypothetical protein n=1 Tax=Coleofasciculus chthonoplastes TaxID=64178 RepID=UPI0032F62C08